MFFQYTSFLSSDTFYYYQRIKNVLKYFTEIMLKTNVNLENIF